MYAFDFCYLYSLKSLAWLRHLINQNKVVRLLVGVTTHIDGISIEQTNHVYDRLYHSKIHRFLGKIYQSEDVDLLVKKELLGYVFKSLYINYYFSKKDSVSAGEQKVLFVPETYFTYKKIIEQAKSYSFESWARVKVSLFARALAAGIRIYDRIVLVYGASFYFAVRAVLSAVSAVKRIKKSTQRHYRFVSAIHQVFQIKFPGKRNFDFFLDHQNIRIDNTLFLLFIPVDTQWRKKYENRGYQFLSVSNIFGLRRMSKIYCPKYLIWNTVKAIAMLLRAVGYRMHELTTLVKAIKVYIDYELLFSQFSLDAYLYANQESFRQIAINMLIRKHGARSISYALSVGGGFMYARTPQEFMSQRHMLWPFLNPDYSLLPSQYLATYYDLHSQRVGQYRAIGSLYSEAVWEKIKETSKEQVAAHYFKEQWGPAQKIVAFFDTTFIDFETYTTFEDGFGFYQDIIDLLESRKDILAIIKPSKDISFFLSPDSWWSSKQKAQEFVRLWGILQKNPRVYWAGDSGDIPTIIAVSDLVVTHCFSSPTVEALAARKKGIWYESSSKHKGLLYDTIPGMVAHGYQQFIERVEFLLDEVRDTEYEHYLEQFIKGPVEPFLDGQAIQRMQQTMLAASPALAETQIALKV